MRRQAVLAIVSLAALGCGHAGGGTHGKRVIVLGVDGMDPGFIERHWNDLPNLRRMRDRGGFSRLATSTPPQSPVAWSTFITGTDPEQHGIFDFVHRDASTMQPLSSMAETLDPAHQLTLGPYVLPLSKARVRSFRNGRAFWEILAEHDIPAAVIRMPTNYPPVEAGRALSGMGTPDLEGTFGTFTYYTDDPLETSRAVSGGRIVAIEAKQHRVVLPVEGPPNTLRRDRRPTRVDLIADVDPVAKAIRCRIGGQEFILREGEWSPWIRVHFELISGLAGTTGIFRLYARELTPAIHIYRTPLNIDPVDPALPVSAPASYGRELAGRVGEFYTQGIPEDTSALRQGALNLEQYLEQSRIVQTETRALLRDCLDHFHDGFLFFYFSEIDQNSHVLWGLHEAELLRTYQAVDQAIGEVAARAGDATLIVMSDHGFASFERAVNLNTWLLEQGFLAVKGPQLFSNAEMFADVDWTRTKAYAMGLNAVYLNLQGREKNGIVRPGTEHDTLLADLRQRLEALRDPETGARMVDNVAVVNPRSNRFAPDLIVGYASGYRASWETALGATPRYAVRKNEEAWIGDHCVAPAAVPGVLLGSRPPRIADPGLKDLTATILKEFGLPKDPQMTGRSVY
jgi:predicted AlkP superfamily phosphohydrolase/phosphomutase